MMIRRTLAATRFIVLLPIVSTFVAALGLMVYEALALATTLLGLIHDGAISPKDVKVLAVGLIEAVDIFLIAIAMYIVSVSLYALFIDDRLPVPQWLNVADLEAVKASLVSVIIAVLAVLFLREAVAWDGARDILAFGCALALIIAALSLYLGVKAKPKA